MPILVVAAAALVMHALLSQTSIGRFIYAQGVPSNVPRPANTSPGASCGA
jgi:ribose/xylose/arabinose/galactoside ABC-type transport system permease subunit